MDDLLQRIMNMRVGAKIEVVRIADTPTRKGRYVRIKVGLSTSLYFVGHFVDDKGVRGDKVMTEYVGD